MVRNSSTGLVLVDMWHFVALMQLYVVNQIIIVAYIGAQRIVGIGSGQPGD